MPLNRGAAPAAASPVRRVLSPQSAVLSARRFCVAAEAAPHEAQRHPDAAYGSRAAHMLLRAEFANYN